MFFHGFPGMPGMEGGPGRGFPGMPGMEGGPGRGGPRKPVDNTKFYKLLEVDKDASEAEIRKAYKKLAVKHHPDKGGDPEKFKEITRAYEVLIDPEKRSNYNRFGEEGIDGDAGSVDPGDIFGAFFGDGRRPGQRRRPKTKDVVQQLKVSLELMYNGAMKKMAITRQVVDKKRGDSFTRKQEREVLEVHIQKGSPDGHKVVFHNKADEHPEADTGDVIFVLKEAEHPIFKRKGADLYVERKISLVEALCGFEMELTHLDGRKLLITTSPGEIVKPMMRGFDPLAPEGKAKMEWEEMPNCDCPSIDNVAQADTTDIDTLKNACETQLKRRGIDVGVFVVDGSRAYFKSCTREEALAAKKTKKGCSMYIIKDPNAQVDGRLMKAVKDEGMPTYKNPFVHGNLFIILTIEFPDTLTPENQQVLRGLLPPPLNTRTFKDDDYEEHRVADVDPVQSYNSNKVNMQTGGEAYDEDEEGRGGGMPVGQQVQCHQQ